MPAQLWIWGEYSSSSFSCEMVNTIQRLASRVIVSLSNDRTNGPLLPLLSSAVALSFLCCSVQSPSPLSAVQYSHPLHSLLSSTVTLSSLCCTVQSPSPLSAVQYSRPLLPPLSQISTAETNRTLSDCCQSHTRGHA